MADTSDLAQLPVDDASWYKRSHLLKLNFIIASLTLYSSTGGYDGSIMGSLFALPLWYTKFMNAPTDAYLGWINACYFLGNGFAFPVGAWISERYGRKMPIYIGYAFLLPGVLMQTTAQSERVYTYARLLLGVASASFMVATPVLINEIALPKHRPIVSALYMSGYYIGGTLSSWVVFGTRNIDNNWCWRIPTVLQLVCPILALTGFLMAPESPRWLISVGKLDEARQMLAIHHGGGDVSHPLVAYQMIEIQAAIAIEKEAKSNASYLDMIKTRGNRHRLFITVTLGIFSQWAGNGVVSYYLPLMLNTVGITSTTHQTLISACLNVWNLLFALAAGFSVEKLGRRFLFLASTITMLISFIIIAGLSGSFASSLSPSIGAAVIPFLFIFFAGYDIALTPFISAYPCEIWQFSLRSRGLTVTWVTAFIALFFNIFVNPIALGAIAWKYYFVFVGMLVIMLITVYFAYPETRGHTLEQMAVLFDGDNDAPPPPTAILEKADVLHRESIANDEGKQYTTSVELV